MRNYKGKDNAGPTLYKVMEVLMHVTYPGENILSSPSTVVWDNAYWDYSRGTDGKYWKFEVNVSTYREKVHLEWIIDTETNSVYPVNEIAKSVLDILDNTDK